MAEILLSLVALALAAAFQPPQVIAVVILLQTRHGLANGLAYVAGMSAFRLALGALAWLLLSRLEGVVETSGGAFNLFVGAVLVVLGVLMLVHGLRQVFSAAGEDEAAASWLDKLQAVSPRQAFFAGIAFLALDPKDWIIDISAISLIAEADLIGSSSLLVYLVYILLAQSLVGIPLLLTAVSPQRARRGLARINTWMRARERQIEIAMAILFGLLFLLLGLEALQVL